MSYLEFWVPIFNRNTGFPDLPGTPGSLSHPKLRVPEVIRNSGFPYSPGNQGSWSHTKHWVLEVTLNYVFTVSPGVLDSGVPDFVVTQETLISVLPGNPEFCVISGTLNPPGDSGSPNFLVNL